MPVTRGQPVWGTLSPPPAVWRPLPGPHWTPGSTSPQPESGGCWGAAGAGASAAAPRTRVARSGTSRTVRMRRTVIAPRRAKCASGLVPQPDHAHLALEAEHRQRPGREVQAPAERHGLVHPAGAERPQHVAVGEDRDVAVDAEDLLDDPVAARGDLL